LPTIAESAVPGYEFVAIDGVFALAKTPEAIIKRLNQEIVRFLNLPETKERFLKTGLDGAPSSPEHFAAPIKSEMTRLAKVIKDADIRAE
jgi:tripartite-type tricarboxylate transporter receptor subunit TctC